MTKTGSTAQQSVEQGIFTDPGMRQLLAKDIMQYGVICVGRDEPVCKAITLCLEKKLSALPVTHDDQLDGILSEKDVLQLLYEREYLPGRVGDYMSTDVVTYNIEDSIIDIHNCLVENPFRRVPIMYENRIAGIIARIDLLRVYKEYFRPVATAPRRYQSLNELSAQEAMKCGLVTVHRDSSLYEAMDLLVKHQITGLPVVDGDMHLEGIITEKDLLDCVTLPEAKDATVDRYMTHYVVTFDRRASLHDVCECLIHHNFHRIPIVDGDRLVGIISRSDILSNRAAMFRV